MLAVERICESSVDEFLTKAPNKVKKDPQNYQVPFNIALTHSDCQSLGSNSYLSNFENSE